MTQAYLPLGYFLRPATTASAISAAPDADFGQLVIERDRILRRNIVGMKVVGDDFRAQAEETFEMIDALLEGLKRFQVFQVADMMTQKSVPPAREAERVLEFRAAGENLLRKFDPGLDRFRGVAA